MPNLQYSTASSKMAPIAQGAMRLSQAIRFICVAFHLYLELWSLSRLVILLVAVRGGGQAVRAAG